MSPPPKLRTSGASASRHAGWNMAAKKDDRAASMKRCACTRRAPPSTTSTTSAAQQLGGTPDSTRGAAAGGTGGGVAGADGGRPPRADGPSQPRSGRTGDADARDGDADTRDGDGGVVLGRTSPGFTSRNRRSRSRPMSVSAPAWGISVCHSSNDRLLCSERTPAPAAQQPYGLLCDRMQLQLTATRPRRACSILGSARLGVRGPSDWHAPGEAEEGIEVVAGRRGRGHLAYIARTHQQCKRTKRHVRRQRHHRPGRGCGS
jgi:hypothetical protein